MSKTWFLTLANTTPKTFFRRVYRGLLIKCNANGPHGCLRHAKEWSRIRSECPLLPPARRNEKSNFLLKIVTFVTKNSEAEKLDLEMGHPRREADLTNAITVQKYGRVG